MGMQSGSSPDDIVTGINVTPLVDVGLVLVIIFMVTAPLFEQPTLNVKLPQSTTKEGKETENVTVTITTDGHMAVNEQEVTEKDFESVLVKKLALSSEKHVIVRADKDALHGGLLLAMQVAKKAGALSIAIATEPKDKGIVPHNKGGS